MNNLHRESVTKEKVNPKSLLGKAIIGRDKQALRQIEKAAREDAADRKAIEQWASRDFQSSYETWELTEYGGGGSLEEKEES